MELNKCLGCMEDFQGYPCPKCSYDPQKETGREYALPLQTILAGKYLIGRVLGQGGFGITYIGWDIALERKVAVKEYYPNGQANRAPGTRSLSWYTSESAQAARQAGMEMFLKEARKMAKVEDIPGVVKVRELFRENETAYIVMDFVEGETLKARLKRTGPMPWAQAKAIFRPAIQAMEKVHQAGLIHRDLSPDNIMLTPNGQVKILDLGAAKDLNVNSGASSMQVAKGGFSPFEQYTQRGGSGPWTDVYAMAATIYFTLTGKLPPAAMDRVEEDTISWNLPGLDALPASALSALQKALAVTAKKRTQSMEELEKGLFDEAPPVQAEARTQTGTKSQPKKVPKKVIWAAVAAVVVVLGGIVYGTILKPASDKKLLSAYKQAAALERFGQYPGAAIAFSELGDYLDSAQRAEATRKMQQMVSLSADISGIGGHTVGLRSDGTVVTTESGSVVSGWSDIVSVSTGIFHTVGLRSDGTVVAVGSNEYGQCNVSGWSDIVAISAGAQHTVGLCSDGTVVAVGWNEYGQCNVSGWSDIVAVSAGEDHTVGLRSDGTVVAMGENEDGRCDVSGWSNIVSVSAGKSHTVGLRSDGTVVAEGWNRYDQCNVNVIGWCDIVAVAAGGGHTVGLRSDGTVVAVGISRSGQCDVSSWSDIVAVAAGNDHTVGLRSDGTVVAVGNDRCSQCDVGEWKDIRMPSDDANLSVDSQDTAGVNLPADSPDTAQEAKTVSGNQQAVSIAAGQHHTVGLRSDGTVVAVGDNDDGECDVGGWSDIVAVAAGYDYTVGLRSDGTVVAMGYNDDGECDVSCWSDIVAVSAGEVHTAGLRSDGTVVAVGSDYCGKCEVSSWTDIVAVSAGALHTVGLRSDGTVVAVGDNDDGQCDVSSWSDIVAVSAGCGHTVGLRSDGTVVAVGINSSDSSSQCDVSGWSDIVAVDAAGAHTVGLHSDGTVVAVGDNDDGQCDVDGWKDILTP